MGTIALFVGAFLIYNAFSMTVVERTREFGLLRAIGITRGQVIAQVLVEGLLLGIIGALMGAGLGLLMSRGLIQIMSVMLDIPLDAGAMQLDVIISSMTIGLVITLLSAVLPAVQAGRISPLEALRLRGQSNTGWLIRFGFPIGLALALLSTGLLVWNPFPYDVQFRLGSMAVFTLFIGAMLLIPSTTGYWEVIARKPFQLLYGSGGQVGARNLQRAHLRTMLTTAALMVGVSMIVVIQGMTTSFSSDLKSWMDAYIGGDLYVNSSVPLKREMKDRFEAVNGVLAAAPIRYVEVTWQRAPGVEEKINFMAVIPSSYTTVTRFVYDDPETDGQKAVQELNQSGSIFVSSVIAEKYAVKEGDILWLRTRIGLKSFRVAATVMDFYNQGMVVTGNWSDMRHFFRVDDASTILIKVRPDSSVSRVMDQIDSLYGKRYQLSLESNASLKERAFGLMGQAFRMFDVLGIIAVMVAALGVVNTVTMSVIERTREIGMLRSIGMTRWQVVMMVLAEAGLLGIIGGILGLGFGVLLTKIFLESMKAMSGYSLALVIPTHTIYTAIVVALAVSQLAALLPAIRAARTPVLEAIHYE
jgi:putative ABC transport system permease protein